MRSLLALVFVLGCGTNNAPTYVVGDGGPGLDGHIDPNPTGTCQTACDCQPGIGCQNGRCMAGTSSTYCCEASTCPGGNACQSSSGSFGTCAGAGVNGSNGGSNGASGGLTGGLGGGIPGIDFDAGFGGLIGGLSGSGGTDDGGIIGGLTGGLGGSDDGGSGGGFCDIIPCSDDGICMLAGCAMCDTTAGKCQ